MYCIVGDFGPSEVEYKERERARHELEGFIQELYPGIYISTYHRKITVTWISKDRLKPHINKFVLRLIFRDL